MTWFSDSRAARAALVTSLLLNLFLGGFVVSRIVARSGHRRFMDRAPLAEHEQGPLTKLFAKRRETFALARGEMLVARRRVHDALVAETFDAGALRSALGQLRTSTSKAQQTMHEALIESAKSMTPDERRSMAKSRRLWRGPGDSHRGGFQRGW